MSNECETLADIVAEMRNPPDIDAQCPWWADGGECGHCPLGGAGSKCSFRLYSDRIEAAWRRENAEAEAYALAVGGLVEAERQRVVISKKKTTTIGNAAALREALTKISESATYALKYRREGLDYGDLQGFIEEMGEDARAALSAPPRQCDVGTAEEQGERCLDQFNEWRRKSDGKKLITAIMAWAQTPYAAQEGAGE